MKTSFLPIVMASLLLAGCSASYKTGQTPDDVYYSSGKTVAAAEIAKETVPAGNDSYQSYFQGEDDYLRMKVRNGGKWNSIDDQDYWYGYNGGCQCNSSWGFYNSFNSFNRPFGFNTFAYTSYYNPWSMNNWYNPGYYYPVIIVNKRPVYTNSSRPGLTGYTNGNYERGNSRNNKTLQYSSGSQFRTIFSGNNSNSNSNNSNSTYDRPTRTFTPSSNSNSSSGSSNSGSSRSSSGGSSGGSSSGRGGRGG